MRQLILYILILCFSFSCQMNKEGSLEFVDQQVTSIPVNAHQASPVSQEQKLIKEALLRFESEDLNKTRRRMLAIVQKHQGYVSGETSSTNSFEQTVSVKVKVPSYLFDSLVADVVEQVEKFESKDIMVKDVTGEYIDLHARINNKKVLEERFLKLLEKTDSVDEMLRIEKKVADVREEIEKAEGRLNYLKRKVSYSEIQLSFFKTYQTTPTFSAEVSTGFLNGWKYIKKFAILIINIWPFILLGLVSWLLLRERKPVYFGKRH